MKTVKKNESSKKKWRLDWKMKFSFILPIKPKTINQWKYRLQIRLEYKHISLPITKHPYSLLLVTKEDNSKHWWGQVFTRKRPKIKCQVHIRRVYNPLQNFQRSPDMKTKV